MFELATWTLPRFTIPEMPSNELNIKRHTFLQDGREIRTKPLANGGLKKWCLIKKVKMNPQYHLSEYAILLYP